MQTEVYQLFREWLTLDPRDEIRMRAVHERARTLHALVGDDFKLRLLGAVGEDPNDGPEEPEIHPMAYDSDGSE